MLYGIIPINHSLLPCTDLQGFKQSCITVVVGSSSIVPDVLFNLCVSSAVSDRDAIFVDGGNSFDPYALSKITKSFGEEPRYVLSRIHVIREYEWFYTPDVPPSTVGVIPQKARLVYADTFPLSPPSSVVTR